MCLTRSLPSLLQAGPYVLHLMDTFGGPLTAVTSLL